MDHLPSCAEKRTACGWRGRLLEENPADCASQVAGVQGRGGATATPLTTVEEGPLLSSDSETSRPIEEAVYPDKLSRTKQSVLFPSRDAGKYISQNMTTDCDNTVMVKGVVLDSYLTQAICLKYLCLHCTRGGITHVC